MKPTPYDDGATSDAGRKDLKKSMNGWRVLEVAIPRADSDRVAYLMAVSGATVRNWRREPESDDDCGTGRRSPLDRVCDLITAIYQWHPQGADLVVEHIRTHLADLKSSHDRRPTEPETLEQKARDLQLMVTELVDELRAKRKEKLQIVK